MEESALNDFLDKPVTIKVLDEGFIMIVELGGLPRTISAEFGKFRKKLHNFEMVMTMRALVIGCLIHCSHRNQNQGGVVLVKHLQAG